MMKVKLLVFCTVISINIKNNFSVSDIIKKLVIKVVRCIKEDNNNLMEIISFPHKFEE